MKRFLLDGNYGAYLAKFGVSVPEVLKKALLPADLFAREAPSLTAEEYFRLMSALDALSPDEQTPIALAASENIEAFSPPVFAAYCSPNARVCLARLAQYKPLIGALTYAVQETAEALTLTIACDGVDADIPEMLIGMEFVFLLTLLRRATKENIVPMRATAARAMRNPAYAAYLGTEILPDACNQLVFRKQDAELPFISENEPMWAFFEPELRKRLSMTEVEDGYAARVRRALMELLPSGECTIDDAARKLGCTRRTLQRRLQEEGTTFQKQLNHTRELLARTYLANTKMRAEDIAFLLGYQDTGAFVRAFSLWTGETVSGFREKKGK